MFDWQVNSEDAQEQPLAHDAREERASGDVRRWRVWGGLLLLLLIVAGLFAFRWRLTERTQLMESDLKAFIGHEEQQRAFGLTQEADKLIVSDTRQRWKETHTSTFVAEAEAENEAENEAVVLPGATHKGIRSTMVGQDGMTLLYVPPGEFLMGSKRGDAYAHPNEMPQGTVYLDAFWIDETEVTNDMFLRFVDETKHQTDAEKSGMGRVCANGGCGDTRGANWRHPNGPDTSLEGLEQHPVVQISWNDALAYCKWAGRRLPTEAEWEKAARGVPTQEGSRTYPWGNEPIADNRVNFCDRSCRIFLRDVSINDGSLKTAPVGHYSANASPYGALDMVGNVWEWVGKSHDHIYYQDMPNKNAQIVRGGSWVSRLSSVRSARRFKLEVTSSNDDVGFRCAAKP